MYQVGLDDAAVIVLYTNITGIDLFFPTLNEIEYYGKSLSYLQ